MQCPKCGKVMKILSGHTRYCDVTPEQRFRMYVNKDGPNGCWVWTGALNYAGYGHFGRTRTYPIRAHRFAWELANGPVPAGLLVLHSCDNRACVNPEHLWLGTDADNMRDKTEKGRQKAKGKLTEDQVKAIRAEYRRTSHCVSNAKELARKYGIGHGAIVMVANGDTWRRVK